MPSVSAYYAYRCQEPIFSQKVMKLGTAWHGRCFRCTVCDCRLADAQFFEYKVWVCGRACVCLRARSHRASWSFMASGPACIASA